MFSIIQSLLSGQAQIYILMVLFSEITTPFVNLRWYIPKSLFILYSTQTDEHTNECNGFSTHAGTWILLA